MFRRRRKFLDLRGNTCAESQLEIERSKSPSDYNPKGKAKPTLTYIEDSEDGMSRFGKSRNVQGLPGISTIDEP